MKPDKQAADKRLKRILLIHKQLRKGDCTGEALAHACAAVDSGVSVRTVRSDIAFMRQSLKAPIESSRYYGYRYNRSRLWSLLEGLDDEPLGTLNEVLALVRQLAEQRSDLLAGLGEALLGLEQQVSIIRAEPYQQIEFENPVLKGRSYLIPLHRFIRKKVFIRVLYKPYKAPIASWKTVFPLQLREFNNRWYLVGWGKRDESEPFIMSLALDRMEQPPAETATIGVFTYPKQTDASAYYEHLIGVTKVGAPEWVELEFSPDRIDYVLTKQIHASQQTEHQTNGSYRVRLFVELNKELEARILEFGRDVTVISPPLLRKQIKANLRDALAGY